MQGHPEVAMRRLTQVRDRIRNIVRPSSNAAPSRVEENMSVSDTSQHSGSQQQLPPLPHHSEEGSPEAHISNDDLKELKDQCLENTMENNQTRNAVSHRTSRKRIPIVNNPEGERCILLL